MLKSVDGVKEIVLKAAALAKKQLKGDTFQSRSAGAKANLYFGKTN